MLREQREMRIRSEKFSAIHSHKKVSLPSATLGIFQGSVSVLDVTEEQLPLNLKCCSRVFELISMFLQTL